MRYIDISTYLETENAVTIPLLHVGRREFELGRKTACVFASNRKKKENEE